MKNRIFANLTPIIFVFTFVYSIILYAFFKSNRRQYVGFQSYDKNVLFQGVIEAVIEENLLYHCL